jgi:hypothetical protein
MRCAPESMSSSGVNQETWIVKENLPKENENLSCPLWSFQEPMEIINANKENAYPHQIKEPTHRLIGVDCFLVHKAWKTICPLLKTVCELLSAPTCPTSYAAAAAWTLPSGKGCLHWPHIVAAETLPCRVCGCGGCRCVGLAHCGHSRWPT